MNAKRSEAGNSAQSDVQSGNTGANKEEIEYNGQPYTTGETEPRKTSYGWAAYWLRYRLFPQQ